MTTVTVFGAGAVGGNVAVRLAAAGVADVSVVARGAHLAAIRERGLTLIRDGQRTTVKPAGATDDPAQLPPQDLVIVALKATALPGAAAALAALRAPGAPVLFLTNGVPWWWSHGLPAGHPSGRASLDLLDPGRQLRDVLGADAALGGVIYSPNEVVEPGVILNRSRSRFVFGEPDGSASARLAFAGKLFRDAGMEATETDTIRREVLSKLLTNAAGNPLAALTRLTSRQRLSDPGLRDLSESLIREVLAVSAALGWPLEDSVDVEELVDPVRVNGARPSMLQDVLGGRPMEVDALLGQVQVFARAAGVATPSLDVVLPILHGLDLHLRGEAAPDALLDLPGARA
jgi:2-dehydropantoate 2-reductase